jgi:ABC-type glutathione transport system ATPase component
VGYGRVRQCPNPFSIDTVLRITHSLVLAEEGGFLVHAASAVRNGRAYLFAGVSGAGKTTMARLAPPDATVLTDEISYVRRDANSYKAYGTPFAGELARVGANTAAPLEALYLLVQGPENCIKPVSKIDAARALMRHVLFFAEEKEIIARVFDSVLEFVSRVEVAQLVFTPDARAWELIR